jgi:hypothetical protein
MPALVRGPLEAEVYWRRRLLVLAVALLLVLGIARVLGQGSDGSDGASPPDPSGTAAQAGAATTSGTPGATGGTDGADGVVPPSPSPSTRKERRQARRAEKAAAKAVEEAAALAAQAAAEAAAKAALTEPQGPCSDTDVVVTPTVPSPVAGSDVVVDLDLRTRFSPACTWSVSPDSLALKITSGPDDIWSSQDCPGVVPTQDVVLRRAVGTAVQVVWNAKRSDDACTGRTDWALPGFYHVMAAALAGEPADVQFELGTPSAPQVTRTAAPKQQRTAEQKAQAREKRAQRAQQGQQPQ